MGGVLSATATCAATVPTVVSRKVASATTIEITYSAAVVASDLANGLSQFSVSIAGTAAAPTAASISGAVLTLTVGTMTASASNNAVTVQYTASSTTNQFLATSQGGAVANDGSAQTVTRDTCDASTPPTNGAKGDCTSTLAAGASCSPTCNTGYTVTGQSTCGFKGVLSATATCAANPTVVSRKVASATTIEITYSANVVASNIAPSQFQVTIANGSATAPTAATISGAVLTLTVGTMTASATNNAVTVQYTKSTTANQFLATSQGGAVASDGSAQTVSRDACDASTPPTNGTKGDCTNALAAGASCQPTCNAGYTVTGPSTCGFKGVLSAT